MKKILALVCGLMLAMCCCACSEEDDVEIISATLQPQDTKEIVSLSDNFSSSVNSKGLVLVFAIQSEEKSCYRFYYKAENGHYLLGEVPINETEICETAPGEAPRVDELSVLVKARVEDREIQFVAPSYRCSDEGFLDWSEYSLGGGRYESKDLQKAGDAYYDSEYGCNLPHYYIHVPKGSIQNNFILDTE